MVCGVPALRYYRIKCNRYPDAQTEKAGYQLVVDAELPIGLPTANMLKQKLLLSSIRFEILM